MYYVYETTNRLNGKTYIGVHYSNDIVKDSYMGSGKSFKKAVEKYGKENFVREILFESSDIDMAYALESELVTTPFIQLKSNYNLVEGGRGGGISSKPWQGKRRSVETKRKISEKLKGHEVSIETKALLSISNGGENNGFYGKKHSEETIKLIQEKRKGYSPSKETREKVSRALTGRKHSEETIKLMSEKKKGKSLSSKHRENISKSKMGNTNMLGKKHSEETKRLISESKKGKSVKKPAPVTCPHCGKTGGSGMYRWHMDNCKDKNKK